MAHVQKIARKPKGVGAEIMGVSDVETGILMQVELVEGRHSPRAKAYDKDYPKGTAAVLRLTRRWRGAAHVVLGDSAFGSLATTVACKEINGHYFMGVVKTAHSGFPMKHLMGLDGDAMDRGDATTMTTRVRDVDVAALMWYDVGKSKSTGKATGQRKCFVFSAGSTAPGRPHKKRRIQNDDSGGHTIVTKDVPQPLCVNHYYAGAGSIDRHNHLRQGRHPLALELAWDTKC